MYFSAMKPISNKLPNVLNTDETTSPFSTISFVTPNHFRSVTRIIFKDNKSRGNSLKSDYSLITNPVKFNVCSSFFKKNS